MDYQIIIGDKVCKYSGIKCLGVRCFGSLAPKLFGSNYINVFGLTRGGSS